MPNRRIRKKQAKIQSVTMTATISLGNYDSIKLSATAEGCNFAALRQCLVEQAGTIGRTHAPTGDLVDAYIRRVFGE